ncbi:MAG: AAA family ATPase, partial [Pyrinomonadaceae bacterium]
MFKLQKLEITGFKSFADHTEIVFTGAGITAIVGPNGCGKSNVAESISWVLGEQRVKNLRSSEMKDVIFQGSSSRAASGMAEVVLHLIRDESLPLKAQDDVDVGIDVIDSTLEEIDENTFRFIDEPSTGLQTVEDGAAFKSDALSEPDGSDGVTPDTSTTTQAKGFRKHRWRHWRPTTIGLDFSPGETVTVARRLYRSGESEYLLNGSECRLRDIQDLFSGTGLSGAQYAIIEQGRISQILSSKPMDRRILIEEAAGITRFRVRQRAAEARLESARTNLRRVSDIIFEIERQVNSLRRQASKARRYQLLREELRDLLRKLFAAEELLTHASLEESSVLLIEATKEEETLNEQLKTCDELARAATAKARAIEESLVAIRAASGEAVLQRDRREREQTYKTEQIEVLGSRLAEIRNEIQDLVRREEIVFSEIDRLHT